MSYRRLRRYFDEDIMHDLVTSSQIEVELEAEWQQLKKDRDTLRTTFPKGNNRVSMQLSCTCNDSYLLLARIPVAYSVYVLRLNVRGPNHPTVD